VLQAVIGMLAPPETPEEAVKRIAHAVGGGDNSDDDDIIMGDTLPVKIRDPLSNLRVQRALRVVGGKNLQPFDLDFFLDSAKRCRKWQCPVSCVPS
jgi:zinc finger MIZ domain-containing protein